MCVRVCVRACVRACSVLAGLQEKEDRQTERKWLKNYPLKCHAAMPCTRRKKMTPWREECTWHTPWARDGADYARRPEQREETC